MGTTVLACPAVHRLRTAHPECQVFFLLFTHIQDSVKVLKIVPDAHVLTIDPSSLGTLIRDTSGSCRRRRRLGIDTVINLEAFTRFEHDPRVSLRRVDERRLPPVHARGPLHRRSAHAQGRLQLALAHVAVARDARDGARPLAGRARGAAARASFRHRLTADCVVPKIPVDAAARARLEALVTRETPAAAGKRLILVNPNASKLISIRKWPLERYAELVRTSSRGSAERVRHHRRGVGMGGCEVHRRSREERSVDQSDRQDDARRADRRLQHRRSSRDERQRSSALRGAD